jgi:hypothetical protein
MAPSLTDRLSGPGPVGALPSDDLPDPAQRVMSLRRYVVAIGVLGAVTIGSGGALATGVLAALGHRISGSGLVSNGVPSAIVALGMFGMAWRSVLIGFREALPVVGDVHRVKPDLRGVLLHWEYARVVAGLGGAFVVIGLIFGGSALQAFPLIVAAVQAVAGPIAARLVARRERAEGRRYFVRIELAAENAERELLWEPDPGQPAR